MGFSRTLALRRREMRLVRLFRRKDSLRVGTKAHNSSMPAPGDHGLEDLFGIVVGQSTLDIPQDLVGLHLVLEL